MKRTIVIPALTLALVSLLACGGKVVVDAGGQGGDGGSGGTTSASTTATGAGGCEALGQALTTALGAALACNPALSSIQCDGSVVVEDGCGCQIAANEKDPAAAAAAKQAYVAWTAAGCGPFECAFCPPAPPAPYRCDAGTSKCVPNFQK
jgi:hypothetical protein